MLPAMLSQLFLQDGLISLRSISLALFLATLILVTLLGKGRQLQIGVSKRRKPRLPPSPPGLPLIGNFLQLGSLPHRSLRALSQKHGPLMLLHVGQVPTLVVSSAAAAREVMKAQDLAFATRPHSKPMDTLTFGSRNIGFAPYGEHWRQAKKAAVVHLLGPRQVQAFRRVREEAVVLMVEKIAAAASPATTVDMTAVLRSFATSVVNRVVIGSSLEESDRNRAFHDMMNEGGAIAEGFRLEEVFPTLASWLGKLPGVDARLRKLFERWDAFLNQILDERERRPRQRGEGLEGDDFVDVLLSMHTDPAMGFPTSRNVVSAMWVEMVGVGAETTYTALDWGMAELIRNPAAMERAQREVREAIGGKPMVTEDDVAQMSYLRAVIMEVLRLHPPAPLLLPRESMEDTQLEGYDIPKKTKVVINAWAISRDPSYWEAPEEFLPERFLDNQQVDFRGNDFQFTPFGSGRRICPGINFSMREMELALASLLYHFDWALPGEVRMEDFDMSESPGIVVHRKPALRLVAIPYAPTSTLEK